MTMEYLLTKLIIMGTGHQLGRRKLCNLKRGATHTAIVFYVIVHREPTAYVYNVEDDMGADWRHIPSLPSPYHFNISICSA